MYDALLMIDFPLLALFVLAFFFVLLLSEASLNFFLSLFPCLVFGCFVLPVRCQWHRRIKSALATGGTWTKNNGDSQGVSAFATDSVMSQRGGKKRGKSDLGPRKNGKEGAPVDVVTWIARSFVLFVSCVWKWFPPG